MTAAFNIIDAMDSKHLWGGWFRNPETWRPWRSFLSVLFGLPLSDASLKLFRSCTGRRVVPTGGFNEAWLICGRRAGKSFILALIACFLAVFRDWRPFLAPGEVGTIKIIASDKKQAKVIHRYCRALLTKVPAFAELIERESDDEIVLTNSITIEIQSANFRSVRGFTLVACLLDEIAYFRTDEGSANPDSEILNALRPSMATIRGAFLLAASSPYSRRGELWRAYRQHHGNENSPVLCWQAPTRTMNPTVPQRIIDEAVEDDASRGGAEYLALFRTDIETFVSREAVEAAVVPGIFEIPYQPGVEYFAFADPSGAAVDSMTLSIAHRPSWSDPRVILDVIRERRPPFSPEAVVDEFADILKAYRVREIVSDRWGGEWVAEAFKNKNIKHTTSERTKSQLYLEFLPLLNSGRVELLDNSRLVSQLCALERRTGRGTGRDVVDHPPGSRDDVINSAAGAVVLAGVPSKMAVWAALGR